MKQRPHDPTNLRMGEAMKFFSLIVKYVIVPFSTTLGVLYSFDVYVIQRANTAIEPTKVKVEAVEKNVAEITIRTRNIERILMEKNK